MRLGPRSYQHITSAVDSTPRARSSQGFKTPELCPDEILGLQGFYPGGTAIAFRQMTNWASRQGFTEFIRHEAKVALHGSAGARLSKGEEIGCGVLGGVYLPHHTGFTH